MILDGLNNLFFCRHFFRGIYSGGLFVNRKKEMIASSNITYKGCAPTARNVHTTESHIYAMLQREEARQLYEAEHIDVLPYFDNDDVMSQPEPLSEEDERDMEKAQDERRRCFRSCLACRPMTTLNILTKSMRAAGHPKNVNNIY